MFAVENPPPRNCIPRIFLVTPRPSAWSEAVPPGPSARTLFFRSIRAGLTVAPAPAVLSYRMDSPGSQDEPAGARRIPRGRGLPGSVERASGRESPPWLGRILARLDAWLPEGPSWTEEDAFRARIALALAGLALPVFVVLFAFRIFSGHFRWAAVNASQVAVILVFVRAVRRADAERMTRLTAVALSALSASFCVLVAAAFGAGLTPPAFGLVLLPLCATLLLGSGVGAWWALVAAAQVVTFGTLGAVGILPRHATGPLYAGEHLALVLFDFLSFGLGALYELRREESVVRIAALERARHAADLQRADAESKARLANAERLAALGQVAAMAAHEINNPLSYVNTNLEIIERGLSGAALDVRDATRDALEGVSRIRRIVDDLRDYARPLDDTRSIADACRAIITALKTAEGHTRGRARVTTSLADVPPVLMNHGRLVQVVLNFVVNAAQAVPGGRPDTEEIRVSVAERGDLVVIAVEDTGPGFSEAALAQVGQVFFTTKRRGEGSGLGLALSAHLLEQAGGRLEIANGVRGAVVRACLPVAPRDTVVPVMDTTPTATSVAPAGTLDVLLIDDDALVTRALVRRVKEHRFTTVTGGREALGLLAGGARFDAIVCDLMMPDLTGMDVHEEVRRAFPGIEERMIFMTGGTFTARAVKFRADLPNRFLDKPIDVKAFRDAIATVANASRAVAR